MGTPRGPDPVKLFIALLSHYEELFPSVERDLTSIFGSIDLSSGPFPWTVTDYYEEEMGPELQRRFVSFALLISPEKLPEIKLRTQGLEEKYEWIGKGRRRRKINIDPGYLDVGKVVLASTKNASHRIYLDSGICGEITLLFHHGSFQPFSYTYRDYLWPETLSFLTALRSLYLYQLKESQKTY